MSDDLDDLSKKLLTILQDLEELSDSELADVYERVLPSWFARAGLNKLVTAMRKKHKQWANPRIMDFGFEEASKGVKLAAIPAEELEFEPATSEPRQPGRWGGKRLKNGVWVRPSAPREG